MARLCGNSHGVRRIPVYVDAPDFEDLTVVIDDKERRKILN